MIFLEDENNESYELLIDKIKEYINRPIFNNINYWYENYTIDKIAEKINNLLL